MSTAVAAPAGGAVAKPNERTIRQWLNGESMKAQFAMALPKHLTADRFVRVVLTAMTKNPKLEQCTQASLFSCLLTLSQFGLEPDGRRAHLIPYENRRRNIVECQLILDYKGLAELAMRSGMVSYIHADVVRTGDLFVFSKGELGEHVPHFLRRDAAKPDSPGEVFAVYALARMKDGSEKAEVLSTDEVLSIRDGSSGWQAFQKGYAKDNPWNPNDPVRAGEMFKKTAFRRLSKWLPLSAEVMEALEHDDKTDRVIETTATLLEQTESHSEQLAALLTETSADEESPQSSGQESGPDAGPETQTFAGDPAALDGLADELSECETEQACDEVGSRRKSPSVTSQQIAAIDDAVAARKRQLAKKKQKELA